MNATAGAAPHVMQVTYSLAVGGSEQLAAAIARAGVKRGVPMSICGLHRGGELETALRRAGVATHVIGRRPGLEPGAVLRLGRLFRRERVSVVITHHLGQLLYGAIGARLCGARLIHVEHEFHTIASRRARRLLRLAGALAERIVAVSDDVAQFLVRSVGFRPARVTTISNGVDIRAFRPPEGGERERLGVPGAGPIIGTVGRLDPAKDHATLLTAFGLVAAEVPDATLVIVGEGAARGEIEASLDRQRLRDRVRLLGARLDVPALVPGLDVFVLSSVSEGLPLALLEAMACARPVVVTEVGAMGPVVARSGAGVVVSPGDAAALARAIVGLVRDRERAARMGMAGRGTVAERYDLEATVDAYLALCVPAPSRARVAARAADAGGQ